MTTSLGLDFGTTNTVVARCLPASVTVPVAFRHMADDLSAIRSVLCFWSERIGGRQTLLSEVGPWAVDHFLEDPGDCRLLQSLKSFAASRVFESTLVYGRRHTFEDLLRTFLEGVLAHAEGQSDALPRRFVVGRPVEFAGSAPDPTLALARYESALRDVGVEEIRFVFEPVAAAFFFAQRLNKGANVFVADFGGGTSDFSVMRFERVGPTLETRALAWSGVGVAGDTFDYRFIDNLIAPRIGKHSSYESMGKVLPMPRRYYDSFARWSELSIMKMTKDFRDLKSLQRMSLEPELIQAFIDLIESDLGFALYRAVSETKERLSSQDKADFRFAAGAVSLQASIDRSEFEAWIADDLRRIEETVEDALRKASIRPGAIDRVFLTGGSSFVPAVRRLFYDRFGREKVETGQELVSVAHGLALIGEREDMDQWCAPD